MLSLYKFTLLLVLSISFVHCSKKSELTVSYGACGRLECEEPFCAVDCEPPPGKCHVKDIAGICYPSCGYLAVLHKDGKYGHHGPDKQPRTEDDPHFLTPTGVSCEESDKWGATDWKRIHPFKDREAHEVVKRGGECCGSDQQVQSNQQEE